MTSRMREALSQARRSPLRRVHNVEHGQPAWPAPSASLRALEARGWLTYSERKTKRGERLEEWAITDAGRQALLPREIFKVERPVYLSRAIPDRRGDYTTNPAWGIDHLPTVDKTSLRTITARARRDRGQQLARTEAERQSQTLEDRLARIRAEARDRGVDIARQELSIQQRIESIERKVRRKAA